MAIANVDTKAAPFATQPVDTTILCPSPPFVTVSGVPNFRDLGAGKPCETIANSPSRVMRTGYIYRCAQPTHITATGRETLAAVLRVHDIFDLRSDKELRLLQTRYPDRPLDVPGVRRHHIPVFADAEYIPISLARDSGLAERADGAYLTAYARVLTAGAHSGAFRTILRHIHDHPDRPLAIHCTVGKDRTGVAAALIQCLCRVDPGAIAEDYGYTTYGLGVWREHLVRRLMEGASEEYRDEGERETGRAAPTREEAEEILASRPEHMREFLEHVVERRCGGVRTFFRERCGFTDAELDTVVSHLICEN